MRSVTAVIVEENRKSTPVEVMSCLSNCVFWPHPLIYAAKWFPFWTRSRRAAVEGQGSLIGALAEAEVNPIWSRGNITNQG